jgi:hypothetical protein
MKIKLSLAVALLLVCSAAFAQADKKSPMDDPMMQAMIKAGTPGDAHKTLDPFVGTWSAKVTSYTPGAPPVVIDGTSEARWVMGGRYVEERFKGEFYGMPFEGLGYTGYDNVKKQYWGTWMDNMSTGLMISTGTSDGKVWTYNGSYPDPMTGKDAAVSTRITVTDADHHAMEMWGRHRTGRTTR